MDKFDISFEVRDINKEMPIHTDNIMKIPRTQYEQLPKNLFKFSEKVNEKYLNNHISIIEEISHKFPSHPLPNWMKHYQNKYFKASLGHDGFFKQATNIDSRIKYRQHNNEFISFGHVNGAALTSGDSSSNTLFTLGSIWGIKLSLGIIGQYYNQVAVNVQSAAGNMRFGAYDDNGSTAPNNLYAQTGSIAATSDFAWRSLTEFALDTSQNWSAWQSDSSSLNVYYKASTNQSDQHTFSYGSFNNPYGTVNTNNSYAVNTKLGHS